MWVRTGMALVIVTIACVGHAVTAVASSGSNSPSAGSPTAPGPERVALRTRTTRTFAAGGGTSVVRMYTGPVNYLADGEWRRIDDRLVRASGARYALENAANRFKVRFPDDLGTTPIRVEAGNRWLSFRLLGADGTATRLAGDRVARYAARPGVFAEYFVDGDVVKENLVLRDASAPATYTYELRLSAGLLPRRASSDDLEIVDHAGEVVFRMAAPLMYDATGIAKGRSTAVKLDVAASGDAWKVTLSADRGWLQSPERRFPVTIDPTTYVGRYDARGCLIVSADFENDHLCGDFYVDVGWDGYDWALAGTANRGLFRFDVAGVVPADSKILNARFGLYAYDGYRNDVPAAIALHRLSRAWTTNATWRRFDGIGAWTQPGGDFNAAAESVNPSVQAVEVFHYWPVTNLVQAWLSGSAPNYGFLLKAVDESGTVNTIKTMASGTGDWEEVKPYLEISYQRNPTLTVTGRLWDRRSQVVTPASYNATLSATAAPGAAIRRLELRVDDRPVDAHEQECPTSDCGLAHTFWFNTSGLALGDHTVRATAIDTLGAKTDRTWTVTADPTRTVFEFDPSVTPDEAAGGANAASADWIELTHTRDGEGGYVLGNEAPDEALTDYKADIAEDHGTAIVAATSGMTLGGDVPTASLGSLASKVTRRDVLQPAFGDGVDVSDDGSPELGVPYPDDLLAEDEWAETQETDPRESSSGGFSTSAESDAKAFAPKYGIVRTYDIATAKRKRRITHTLTFGMDAVGDRDGDGDKDESPFERSNALDHGYEHDFKLIDPNANGSGKHPVCTDEKENFWAQRKGYYWTTSFPQAAHPYFDDNTGDPCKFLDFTVGLEYPLELRAGKTYTIRVWTRRGDKATSPYYVNAQKTFRACSANPRYCAESSGPGAEGQLLVGGGKGVTMECRRWHKGFDSRRVGSF